MKGLFCLSFNILYFIDKLELMEVLVIVLLFLFG